MTRMSNGVGSTLRFSGSRLRARRVRVQMQREELALKVARSAHSIASYELGRAVPSIETLGALASALGCTIDDLFDRETEVA